MTETEHFVRRSTRPSANPDRFVACPAVCRSPSRAVVERAAVSSPVREIKRSKTEIDLITARRKATMAYNIQQRAAERALTYEIALLRNERLEHEAAVVPRDETMSHKEALRYAEEQARLGREASDRAMAWCSQIEG